MRVSTRLTKAICAAAVTALAASAAQDLSLADGEVFRILSPNGGETYSYGDTIVCTWLQRTSVCDEAIIRVTSTAGLFWCAACGESEQQWLVWPRDLNRTGEKSLEQIDSTTVKGTFRLPVQDMLVEQLSCSLTFRGDEMLISVYDEYSPPGCENCADRSDAFFSIRGSANALTARPGNVRQNRTVRGMNPASSAKTKTYDLRGRPVVPASASKAARRARANVLLVKVSGPRVGIVTP